MTWVDPQFLASPTTQVELSWTFYQALELSWPKVYISDLDLTWPKLNIPIQVNLGLTQSSKRSTFFKSTQGKVEKTWTFSKKKLWPDFKHIKILDSGIFFVYIKCFEVYFIKAA